MSFAPKTQVKLAAWTVLAVSIAAVTGCGGTVGSTNSPSTSNRYVGSFTDNGTINGKVALTIGTGGTVNGTGLYVSQGSDYEIFGISVPIEDVVNGNQLSGTLSYNVIPMDPTLPSHDPFGGSSPIDLVLDSSGSVPSFAGAIGGTATVGGTVIGNLQMVVDANGNVLAVLTDTSNSTIYTLTGTITNGGVIDLTLQSGTGTLVGTLTGTLSRNGTSVTGTLNNSKGGTIVVNLTLS